MLRYKVASDMGTPANLLSGAETVIGDVMGLANVILVFFAKDPGHIGVETSEGLQHYV